MFLEEATNELRQGDICFGWPVPKWLITDYQVLSDPEGKRTKVQVSVHSKGADLPIILCSHDCDLENPRTRMGFLVAPIFPWPFPDLSTDDSLGLISSSKPDDNEFNFINLFPLQIPDPEADNTQPAEQTSESAPEISTSWRVVDFSGIISVGPPTKAIPILRKGKRLEMTEDGRLLFKRKLAAFLGR